MQITITLPQDWQGDPAEVQRHLQAIADRLTIRPNGRGRPTTNKERDKDIYRKSLQGLTHAQLAAVFGISMPRVAQILAQMRASEGATMTQGEGSV